MLVFAVFMLTGGTLGDIFGRKKVLLGGVALFSIGSLMAVLAHSVGLLIAGRVVMGIGAAASEPGTLSMIRHVYPEAKARVRALGVWAAVSGMALAFGPIIGGIIIGFTSWRGVFAFGAIFGVLVFIAGLKYLPESSDPVGRKIDVSGLISGALAISAVTAGLIMGETYGYETWWVALLFGLSISSAVAFIWIEGHKKDPVLPLKFFKKMRFTIANVVAFVTNFAIFAVFFFVALYLELIANFSGYQIALAFLSMTAAIVISAILAARKSARSKTGLLTVAGCLLSGAGVFIINYVLSPNISAATLSWALAISGVGFGISLVTMTSSVLNIVPAERSGMAASTVNTFRELGGVFGVAVLGSIVNGRLNVQLVSQLKALHLPANFQSFVVYAITHGGNTPAGVAVNPAILATHAKLITEVENAAFSAFGNGLSIALNLAGGMLMLTGIVSGLLYYFRREKFNDLETVN
jgi:MFS family permease